jgi:dTDP-4-dehydrorhamnose reductase
MDTRRQYSNPEIWGGIECTINRVGDSFRDQLEYSGFYERPSDLDEYIGLGIKALRFPVLWERHIEDKEQQPDFTWAAAHLHKMQHAGVQPIVGLVHHGSGPTFTSLYDNNFPELLAAYATQVATAFPWVEYYTPVNEPLTTARFSGLYGLWYPHHKNNRSFLRMLFNQVRAIVLSMQAIRKINPSAKLVQTEDLAFVHASPKVAYQAKFENQRRWLTYDLLCGRVKRGHPLYTFMLSNGIKASELAFLTENICEPDIAGFNYYVTSERYLDEQVAKYPPHVRGGNGRHRYADVEAVRVTSTTGVRKLLAEAWKRYQIPLALTEVHLGCTREEQMRWLKEIYVEAQHAIQQGINLKAITAWALAGSFDWNSLLTREAGHYEAGVFDLSGEKLRYTAVTALVRSLAAHQPMEHPVLDSPGWWHREQTIKTPVNSSFAAARPLMIIGKTGTLGHAFTRLCEQRGIRYVALSREDCNILDEADIERAIVTHRPWAVVNATGYVLVDDAETNAETCFAINSAAPALMSKVCAQRNVLFMTFSSDLVFNGEQHTPYVERDIVQPLNVYGRSKAEGEGLILRNNPTAIIIRTSAFFGPWDKSNFAWHVLENLKQGRECVIPRSVTVSPTYVPDLVNSSLDVLIDRGSGIWHISNDGNIPWSEFAEAVAVHGGHSTERLSFRDASEMHWKAQRPMFSALKSDRGIQLPSFHQSLDRFFNDKIY